MTPDNREFAIASYVAAAVVYVFYALSVYWRTKQVRNRLDASLPASDDVR